MTLTVNGATQEVSAGTTVRQLLEALGINPLMVAVEVNVDIVARDRYAATVLRERDVVEVVQMVGGGAAW